MDRDTIGFSRMVLHFDLQRAATMHDTIGFSRMEFHFSLEAKKWTLHVAAVYRWK